MKNQVDLWDEQEEYTGKYLVLAGVNKRTNRQLYLSTFEDCNEWSISVVPSQMSHSKAKLMIEIASADIESGKVTRYGKLPVFEMVKINS